MIRLDLIIPFYEKSALSLLHLCMWVRNVYGCMEFSVFNVLMFSDYVVGGIF